MGTLIMLIGFLILLILIINENLKDIEKENLKSDNIWGNEKGWTSYFEKDRIIISSMIIHPQREESLEQRNERLKTVIIKEYNKSIYELWNHSGKFKSITECGGNWLGLVETTEAYKERTLINKQ